MRDASLLSVQFLFDAAQGSGYQSLTPSHETNVSYKKDVTWCPVSQSNGSICFASRQVRKGPTAMTGSFLLQPLFSCAKMTAKEVSDPPTGRSSHNALVEQPF